MQNLHRFDVHKFYWTRVVDHFNIFAPLQPTIAALASILSRNLATPYLLLRQQTLQLMSFSEPPAVESRAGFTRSDAVRLDRLDTQPCNAAANTAKIHQAWNAMLHFPLRCGPHKSGSRLHIRSSSNLRHSFELWNEIIFSHKYIYKRIPVKTMRAK